MTKKELLEYLVKDEIQTIEMYKEKLEELPQIYVEGMREKESKKYNGYIFESVVKVEAYQLLLKSLSENEP